ncbi:sucrase ferredoxin domain-containing protein [Rutstroemia sp. NJR-2017a BBW]|nr:sucrase ferredoxin domain-containing protein [Rutstroemia sp. NJR-2017a BBW]
MIAASLARSAAVAWDSRPRVDQRTASSSADQTAGNGNAPTTEINGSVQAGHPEPTAGGDASIILLPENPVWGEIEHKGWSSPTSKDLPNLQYISVILELPHLIEAKAVSLAPADPQSSLESPVPDLRAVDILQRPATMGLRDYLTHLITFGVVGSPEVATSFLTSYEYARFSSDALTELEFRNLMKQFAEVLRCMGPLSPAVITSLDIDGESDIDGDASSSTTSSATPVTPQNRSSGSEGTIRTAPSRRPGTNYTAASQNLHAGPEFVTPRSHKTTASRPSSQNRRLYSSSSSSSSMRSIRSQTSVIKLNRTHTDGALPYTLHIPRVR